MLSYKGGSLRTWQSFGEKLDGILHHGLRDPVCGWLSARDPGEW